MVNNTASTKTPQIVIEGKMNYEDEWTELDTAVNSEHAKRLLNNRFNILKRSDKRYKFRQNTSEKNQFDVMLNRRVQRNYRVVAK